MYATKMEALHGAVGRYVENRKRELQKKNKSHQSKTANTEKE